MIEDVLNERSDKENPARKGLSELGGKCQGDSGKKELEHIGQKIPERIRLERA